MSKSGIFLILTYVTTCSCIQINPNCDYYQNVQLGQEYFIFNQEYPNLYHAPNSCRWMARSPVETVIVLNCAVNIPQSQNCQFDKLSISLSGDENLGNVYNFCGNTSFSIFSDRNSLSVGLFSNYGSSGGTFICSLAAMRVAPRWCTCSVSKYQEEGKIVGGQNTRVNEFPWMAALIDVAKFTDFCGASIISERYAVTAAHCLLHQNANNLGLLVGDHDLNTGTDTATSALLRISQFFQHPYFDSQSQINDIALLRTASTILFNQGVGPVCLPFKYGFNNFVNQQVTALGWGFTDFSGNKAHILQKVELSVVSNFDCASSLRKTIQSTQMCTFAKGKDSCTGDSGGPVLYKDASSKKYEFVGIISYGIACATRTPAVNTRITSYLSWIVSLTTDAMFCIR